MSRNRTVIIGVVVVVFVAAAGFLALQGIGGGGKAVTMDLKVTGTAMSPDNPKAQHNDAVTMTITTDKDEEIHLHGYDIAFDCKAGQPLTKTFKADKTGNFDMEIEATSQQVGTFTVS
jgi:copper(I)-binding protein